MTSKLLLTLSLISACLTPFSEAFAIVQVSHQESAELGQTVTLMCRSDSYYEFCAWRHKSDLCEFEWKADHEAVKKQRCGARINNRVKFVGEWMECE